MTTRYRSPYGPVEFTEDALQVFEKHRQHTAADKEAGGQLFCRFDKAAVVIEHATTPTAGDRRTRFSFFPNRRREQADIREAFRDGLHYIGDWHSHPEAIPSPSGDDLQKISDIFAKSHHSLRGMIMVIVGTKDLWVGLVTRSSVCKLDVCD